MSDEEEIIDEPAAILRAEVVSEGSPKQALAVLEEKAALANRFREATFTILAAFTFPEDWTPHGDFMCLGYAGAERIGARFSITYHDVESKKENFTDAIGEGYRYIFTGYATLKDLEIYAEGIYSTRDEFLGKKGGALRPLEDISEPNIRRAAHHIFMGNAIKGLFGVHKMPKVQYQRIMGAAGRPTQTKDIPRGSGTQGGTSEDDARHQKELAEICLAIANAAMTVDSPDGKQWNLRPLGDSDARDSMEIAKNICQQLSTFSTKEGETITGKDSAKALKGKWLNSTLAKARKLAENLPLGGEE